jgi:hypothetical protein
MVSDLYKTLESLSKPGNAHCMGSATLKVSSKPENLLPPPTARGALITVENDGVRWQADGTDPTPTSGHYTSANGSIVFDSWSNGVNWQSVLKSIKFIRVTGDAILRISYFN